MAAGGAGETGETGKAQMVSQLRPGPAPVRTSLRVPSQSYHD